MEECKVHSAESLLSLQIRKAYAGDKQWKKKACTVSIYIYLYTIPLSLYNQYWQSRIGYSKYVLLLLALSSVVFTAALAAAAGASLRPSSMGTHASCITLTYLI